MIRSFILILFIVTVQQSSAQTLSDYVNKLFLNVFVYSTDTATQSFLDKYVPSLAHRPKIDTSASKGGWVAYPPGVFKEESHLVVTNNYVFTKHPYFDGPIKAGQFEVKQKVYTDKKWIDNIQDIRLWFDFDNEKDAKTAFNKLVDTLSTFQTLKKVTSNDGIQEAEFTDKNSVRPDYTTQYTPTNEIRFVLAKDNFTRRGYRILFQLGNDLY